jgi:hypothetical protein
VRIVTDEGHSHSLMRKFKAAGTRLFKPDYLYSRPKCSSIWFTAFDEPSHVTTTADYNPGLPVHLAVDPAVHRGNIRLRLRPGFTA